MWVAQKEQQTARMAVSYANRPETSTTPKEGDRKEHGMSKEAFERFARDMSGDAALDQELTAYVGNAEPAGVPERVAAFARERGYDVEPADVRRAQVDGAELSDEELDLAAGWERPLAGDGYMFDCTEMGMVTCDKTSLCSWDIFCPMVHYHDKERPFEEWQKIIGD